ncbi:hypothetical protein GCM10009836_36470 [Pseudonocardia ailaonensis]|uniref:Uncharacterized protein n=1 Tax=Pseudonocardia ailaonensis TaxID=367279 RepID=A0ABN2N636_9PSEU
MASYKAEVLHQAYRGGLVRDRTARWGGSSHLRTWFEQHERPVAGDPVLFWVDTFTEVFSPEGGIAAVTVLEGAATMSNSVPAACAAA